jgi:D-cysteine desulfhydrase family pyridoxal phosphate-dependent enzyme
MEHIMTMSATRATLGRLADIPRESLGSWPTPVERLDRLSSHLGIDLWLKRDDLTGLALGGNKVRKLEFLLAHARKLGADIIITTGGSQSNHARLTAAACRRLALQCVLVLDRGRHPSNGNLLLDQLFGAEIELIDDPDPATAAARMESIAGNLRDQGHIPYVIPRGGSIPQGAIGYLNMVYELTGQLEGVGTSPTSVYVATGSCGTHSGIMAGRAACQRTWRVQGISVSRAKTHQEEKVKALSNAVLAWCGIEGEVSSEDVDVDDGFTGDGYGIPTAETWNAIHLLASVEGLVVDPVYTGKALAGLLAHVESGRIRRGETVVFIHTGGAPALFGYADEIPAALLSSAKAIG